MGKKPVPVLYFIYISGMSGAAQKVELVRPEPHYVLQIGGTHAVTISKYALIEQSNI